MEIFKIEVKEVLSRIIEIEANSAEQALSKVIELYGIEEIVLGAEDSNGTEFSKLKNKFPGYTNLNI